MEAIIGGIAAAVIAIFAVLFHRRGVRIKELEGENEAKDRQNAVHKAVEEISREEANHSTGTLDERIDSWNGMQDGKPS